MASDSGAQQSEEQQRLPQEPKLTQEQLIGKHAQLRDANQRSMQALATEGLQMPDTYVLQVRMETLIEAIFDDTNRLTFEVRFEQALNRALRQAQSEVTQSKFMSGAPGMNDFVQNIRRG